MLHSFVDGTAIFTDERMHAYRGRSVTQCAQDAADPDFPGARAFAKAHGLPYIRGGLMELGGSQDPISEAQSYQTLLAFVRVGQALRHRVQAAHAGLDPARPAGRLLAHRPRPALPGPHGDPGPEGQGRVRPARGPDHLERGQARAGGPAVLHPQAQVDDDQGRGGRGTRGAGHRQQRRRADRQPHHGRHDDGHRPGRQRHRRLRPGARPGQRLRGRRLRLRHLGRAQPDQHPHGRGPAQHAPPGRDAEARAPACDRRPAATATERAMVPARFDGPGSAAGPPARPRSTRRRCRR